VTGRTAVVIVLCASTYVALSVIGARTYLARMARARRMLHDTRDVTAPDASLAEPIRKAAEGDPENGLPPAQRLEVRRRGRLRETYLGSAPTTRRPLPSVNQFHRTPVTSYRPRGGGPPSA
jgi:hypothetical protein